jgi:hypothetical protein
LPSPLALQDDLLATIKDVLLLACQLRRAEAEPAHASAQVASLPAAATAFFLRKYQNYSKAKTSLLLFVMGLGTAAVRPDAPPRVALFAAMCGLVPHSRAHEADTLGFWLGLEDLVRDKEAGEMLPVVRKYFFSFPPPSSFPSFSHI